LATKLVMPKLGLNMKEGKILEWYKKEGDAVAQGEALLSVETDKVATDIESPDSGILSKIWCKKNETANVGQIIGLIGQVGEDNTEMIEQIETGFCVNNAKGDKVIDSIKEENLAAVISNLPQTKLRITPKARKIASELNLNFALLQKRYGDKRITEENIQEFVQEMKSDDMGIDSIDKLGGRDTRVKLTAMRKSIALKMLQSSQKTASATNAIEVDVTELRAIIDKIKKEKQLNISFTAYIIRIVATLLEKYPMFNATLLEDEQEILIHGDINIGCAVDVPDGLLVPVINNANMKSIKEITNEISGMAEKARTGILSYENLQNGTFTISNLGMFEIDFIMPIINYPEVAILGIGKAKTKPRYILNQLEPVPRELLWLTLSYDHRVIDGAPASHFLKDLKELIEYYYLLLAILK